MKRYSFVLYIDESGDFESAADGRALAGSQKSKNQIVGLLAPDDGTFGEILAGQLLRSAHHTAGADLVAESHAKDKDSKFVNAAVGNLLASLPADLQPVRIVNREQIDFGGHDATYTHMVAELILRLFVQLSRSYQGRIRLRLHGANIVRIRDGQLVKRPQGFVETVPAQEYAQRIREALAFATVRQGLTEGAREWEFVGVDLSPARKVLALQLCDLLSNASFNGFARLTEQSKITFMTKLGSYDFTLKSLPLLDRIDDYLAEGEPALAIRCIAEGSMRQSLSSTFIEEIAKRSDIALDAFAKLPAPIRRAQSAQLDSWLMQLERQRFLDLGESVASWLLKNVIAPVRLRNPIDPFEVDEFEYSVRHWHLKLLTHQGRLKEARAASNRLDELVPLVAGSIDAVPALLNGQIAQAVHYTDCLDFTEAIGRLKSADALHMDIQTLFGKKYGVEGCSEARGKNLSCWSQVEMLASKGTDAAMLRESMQLNELAIVNFSSSRDISQVLQYRCQIDTIAGNFADARKSLAKAIGASTSSHKGIAESLPPRSFPLLHWWRLGAHILKVSPESEEAKEFIESFGAYPESNCPWDDADFRNYPATGLLRQAAAISASMYQFDASLNYLKRLGQITPHTDRPILGAIHIAAMLEVAILTAKSDRRTHRLVLGESPNQFVGLRTTVARCRDVFSEFPQMNDWINRIGQGLQEVLSGRRDIASLYSESAIIGY